MRQIMVLNAKGGSGKSTIATNLASYYALQGYDVVLADCDPQGSSMAWLDARPAGRPRRENLASSPWPSCRSTISRAIPSTTISPTV